MKIPKTVKIGPHIYRVIVKTPIIGDDNQLLYGQSRYWDKQILVDSTRGKIVQEETFIHELIHCLNATYHPIAEDLKEEEVERLGIALYQLIKDNPEVFK